MAPGRRAGEPLVKCYFAIPQGVTASPEEEQGSARTRRRYGIALLTAQAVMVQHSQDLAAPKTTTQLQDSMRPWDAHGPSQPAAAPTCRAWAGVEEAHPCIISTSLQPHSSTLEPWAGPGRGEQVCASEPKDKLT